MDRTATMFGSASHQASRNRKNEEQMNSHGPCFARRQNTALTRSKAEKSRGPIHELHRLRN